MADQYLQQLDRVTEAASTDLLPISDDPAGASRLRAIAVGDLVPFRPPAPPSAAAQAATYNPDGSFAGWATPVTQDAGGDVQIGASVAMPGGGGSLAVGRHLGVGAGLFVGTLGGFAGAAAQYSIRVSGVASGGSVSITPGPAYDGFGGGVQLSHYDARFGWGGHTAWPSPMDTSLARAEAGVVAIRDGTRTGVAHLLVDQIRTPSTAPAATLGTVTGRYPIYDEAGSLVGYIPIYDAIED